MRRANTTVHLPGRQTVEEGDLYDDDDPWVKKYPQFFDDAETVKRDAPVEQATARPGEKRSTKKPAEKKKPAQDAG